MASKSTKAKKSTKRKLAAILSADVVGYSRLMGADEEASLSQSGYIHYHCREHNVRRTRQQRQFGLENLGVHVLFLDCCFRIVAAVVFRFFPPLDAVAGVE